MKRSPGPRPRPTGPWVQGVGVQGRARHGSGVGVRAWGGCVGALAEGTAFTELEAGRSRCILGLAGTVRWGGGSRNKDSVTPRTVSPRGRAKRAKRPQDGALRVFIVRGPGAVASWGPAERLSWKTAKAFNPEMSPAGTRPKVNN